MDVSRVAGLPARHAISFMKAGIFTTTDVLSLSEPVIQHVLGTSLHAGREAVQIVADAVIPPVTTVRVFFVPSLQITLESLVVPPISCDG